MGGRQKFRIQAQESGKRKKSTSGNRISSFGSRVRKFVSKTHKDNLGCAEITGIQKGKAAEVQMGMCARPQGSY